jgi:hypothetical protein
MPGQELPLIAECRLDLDGLRRQRDRYRRIGEHIERLQRRPHRLEVWFEDGVDGELIRETVDVERECCPFYRIDLDEEARRLSFSVDEEAQDPALDAIRFALTGTAG